MLNAMRSEWVHPEQLQFFRQVAAEYRTAFKQGLLAELQPYPSFVTWRYKKDFRKPPYSQYDVAIDAHAKVLFLLVLTLKIYHTLASSTVLLWYNS